MSLPTSRTDGAVTVVDLGDGENRFSPAWLAHLTALYADLAAADGPRALVTSATGKFWSNGLDLDWLGAHPDAAQDYVGAVHALFVQVLTMPVPTVAALQGHTFAAGAMLALAHDSRLMRADRGFFCLPEVDIQIPFTPGMGALLQARLTPQTAHEAMTTGRRYGGTDALAAGLVEQALPADDLLPAAIERAAGLATKAGPTLGAIKTQMYGPAVALLRAG